MIAAQELRIGNWVKCPNPSYFLEKEADKIFVQVGGMHDDAMLIWGYYDFPITLDQVEPIPLTPEILEKAGFRYNYFDGYTFQLDLPNHRGLSFTQPNFEQVWFSGSQLPCKHLHQLQNLYFALTGEELAIIL